MRRRALRIAVFLLLGAVTTVAVAWYFGWTVLLEDERFSQAGQTDREGFTATEAPCWLVTKSEIRGARHWRVVPMPTESSYGFWAEELERRQGLLQPPLWMAIEAPPPRIEEVSDPDADFTVYLGHARGWPVPGMYSVVEFTWMGDYIEGPAIIRNGILVDQPDPGADWLLRVLPLGIIWGGFAIDTVLYGLLWLGVFFTLGVTRRYIRRRRGRCTNCAYNLRGNTSGVCPECGAAIQGRHCK